MDRSDGIDRRIRVAALGLALALLFPLGALAAETDPPDEITLEWIYKKDDLGIEDPAEALPGGFRWSPKGHLLAFGQQTDLHDRILVVMDPAAPDEKIVLTGGQLRALIETIDEHRDDGVVPEARPGYAEAIEPQPEDPEGEDDSDEESEEEPDDSIGRASWLEDANRLRFRFAERRWIFDPVAYRVFPDVDPDLPEGERENTQRSPDDRYAAYNRDNDLYVFDFENRREHRLTDSGSDTLLNGKFPWVYWEELMWRRSYRAFWWSPGADAIAFLQFDEDGVSGYPITDFSEPVPKTYTQRYPKVGTTNPSVRLGIVSLSSREPRWVDLGKPHEYLINVAWTRDGSSLSVQTLNRKQDRLGLYRVDPVSARGSLVLEEARDTWVDTFEAPRFLDGDGGFVWMSERTGYRHLYRWTGDELRALTSGDWVVEQPGFGGRSLFLDRERGRIYFRATRESPLERHVYWVSLSGGKPKRITREPGMHSMSFSDDGAYWLDTWSSVDVPRRVDLRDRDGREIARLAEITPQDHAPVRFARPEFVEIEAEDGARLYGSLLKPLDFDPSRRYPVVAFVYGEPAGQVVLNRWVSSFEMVLVNHGFVVFRFDARGTPGRGRPWLDPIYGNQTDLPMQDWTAAVAWLESQPFVDGDRLGVWGWSGGGTMTLNLMLRTPGLFEAGAAVAAVTDKRLYDTIYTERYLGMLADNEEGYKKSSPLFAADQLEGELLIAHGISDDNVHVQNAYNLVEALSEAEKDFRLFVYPQKDHGIGGDVQFHLFERILGFFVETLRPRTGE